MPHWGFSLSGIACCVKMVSPGRRLTRPAPLRMAPSCAAEIPLRLLRIEPVSLRLSLSPNFRGGANAKSKPVNVLDFWRACLKGTVSETVKITVFDFRLTGWEV